MALLSGNAMRDDEPAPLVVEFGRVAQNRAELFDARHDSVSLNWRETKSVEVQRPSGDSPEFVQNLRNRAQTVTATSQYFQGAKDFSVLCRVAVDGSTQDIRIRQHVHLLPLVFAGIDALTAERLIRDGRYVFGNDVS